MDKAEIFDTLYDCVSSNRINIKKFKALVEDNIDDIRKDIFKIYKNKKPLILYLYRPSRYKLLYYLLNKVGDIDMSFMDSIYKAILLSDFSRSSCGIYKCILLYFRENISVSFAEFKMIRNPVNIYNFTDNVIKEIIDGENILEYIFRTVHSNFEEYLRNIPSTSKDREKLLYILVERNIYIESIYNDPMIRDGLEYLNNSSIVPNIYILKKLLNIDGYRPKNVMDIIVYGYSNNIIKKLTPAIIHNKIDISKYARRIIIYILTISESKEFLEYIIETNYKILEPPYERYFDIYPKRLFSNILNKYLSNKNCSLEKIKNIIELKDCMYLCVYRKLLKECFVSISKSQQECMNLFEETHAINSIFLSSRNILPYYIFDIKAHKRILVNIIKKAIAYNNDKLVSILCSSASSGFLDRCIKAGKYVTRHIKDIIDISSPEFVLSIKSMDINKIMKHIKNIDYSVDKDVADVTPVYKNKRGIDVLHQFKAELIEDIRNGRIDISKYPQIIPDSINIYIEYFISHINGSTDLSKTNRKQTMCIIDVLTREEWFDRDMYIIDMCIASNHCYSRKNEFCQHYYSLKVKKKTNSSFEYIKNIIDETIVFYSKMIAIDLSNRYALYDVHYVNSMMHAIGLQKNRDSTIQSHDKQKELFMEMFDIDILNDMVIEKIYRLEDKYKQTIKEIIDISLVSNNIKPSIKYKDYLKHVMGESDDDIANKNIDEIKEINKDIKELNEEYIRNIYISTLVNDDNKISRLVLYFLYMYYNII